LLLLSPQGVGKKGPRDDQQFGHRRVGQFVQHGVAHALGPNDLVEFENRQMLGQQRGFDPGCGQDLGNGGGTCVGRQDLQDADPRGVRQRLEQVRLDLVERTLIAAETVSDIRDPPFAGLMD